MQLLANHPFLFFLISLVFMTLAAWLGATVLRRNKAVKSYINQWLTKVFVQIIGLPHCSEGGSHA